MPEDLEDPSAGEPAPARDSTTVPLIFGTVAIIALAVVMSIAALVAADDDDTAASAGSSVQVSLSEFAITPSSVTASAGGSLHVTNDGTATHNLRVVDTELITPDLAAGETGELDISSLEPGGYELICEIAGHEDAGMTAQLTVTEGGGTVAAQPEDGEHAAHGELDYDQMTEDMLATMAAFPAETEGVGNELLEPTEVTADGTKVFDLTMELADWEVSPGEVVEAWTFNGMVPAPRMELEVGDKVEVRVQNDLPVATDVHWHGVNVDQPQRRRGSAHPGPDRAGVDATPTRSRPTSRRWRCTTRTPTGTCSCPTACSAPSSWATCASRAARPSGSSRSRPT